MDLHVSIEFLSEFEKLVYLQNKVELINRFSEILVPEEK